MGRGRAKAKQTKVARQLKYSTPNTDLSALQTELGHGGGDERPPEPVDVVGVDEIEVDPYAKYYPDDDEDADAS